jgi:DNA-binding NarL/FixJ family response regulator
MTRVALIGSNRLARREVRQVLEAAGIEIVAEGATIEDVAEHPVDVVVTQTDATTVGNGFHEALTTREHEVLELLADGLSNRRAAERLGISEHTVKFHVASIYGKLGASSRAEAIRRAARRGLITI